MPPAKSMTIGRHFFSRQLDAISHFKNMLNKYKLGARVEGDDASDLLELLNRHLTYEEKIGVGISHFKVDHDNYGGRCFWIVRVDGSEVDFSYRSCITGRW